MNNKKNNKGYSLIELLVALAIMSIFMIVVVQFMGTTSGALNKTRKKLDLQTKAMEFREQFSDIMMQATYVRVQVDDTSAYKLDTSLGGNNRRQRVQTSSTVTLKKYLASDSYPQYIKAEPRDMDIYMDSSNYTLFGSYEDPTTHKHTQYPSTVDDTIQSFRALGEDATLAEPNYVIPKYIFVRYQPGTDGSGKKIEKYAIFYYKSDASGDGKVYMAKGTFTETDKMTTDGMGQAIYAVESNASADSALLADNVKDFYFSANADTNTVLVDLELENKKYTVQTYDYRDSIVLRNTYSLTVPPNRMFKKVGP